MELKLLNLIRECEKYLDKESVDEVMHFYKYGEYEMALEGLPENYTTDAINDLALYYHLNIESVFDYYF